MDKAQAEKIYAREKEQINLQIWTTWEKSTQRHVMAAVSDDSVLPASTQSFFVTTSPLETHRKAVL